LLRSDAVGARTPDWLCSECLAGHCAAGCRGMWRAGYSCVDASLVVMPLASASGVFAACVLRFSVLPQHKTGLCDACPDVVVLVMQ
jgi:hypothetical protein